MLKIGKEENKDMEQKNFISKGTRKSIKGITLIALVITIIVLLILAGVSIATLTGDNGILTRATDAKEKNEIASVKEQAQLDITNWVAGELENGRDGAISDWEDIKNILDTSNPDAENRYYKNVTEEGVETPNGYIVPIEELYTNSSAGGDVPNFDENNLTIGEAINTDKYGYIVPEYTVQASTMSSNVWRLFYQDSNYTYLITDEVIGGYLPSDYYDTIKNETGELKYQTGADVSVVGQKLSPMLLETGTVFTESNTGSNIRATAWLTDTSETSMWNEYKNSDAVFAIGSPTVELYVASFNATSSANSSNQITLGVRQSGYTQNTKSNQLKTSYNYGIYNKGASYYCWLASPSFFDSHELYVDGDDASLYFDYVGSFSFVVRPIVCIQTSVFNEKYTLPSLEDNS